MHTHSASARPAAITVGEILSKEAEEWDLELIAGKEGLDRIVSTFELNRPGLALAGYYDLFSVERVQIIGLTETRYLNSLPVDERRVRIRRMFEFPLPCVILTRSLDPLPEMIEAAEEFHVPLLRTTHITSPFQAGIGQFLERRLAPRWIVQGVMVEVFGMGILIQGKSAVGKSECALELIQRGHLLVADDVVQMRRVSRGRLFGEPVPSLGHHMELRGIGIIDAEMLFGVRAIREESELRLVVELEKWVEHKEYERLGLDDKFITLLGCVVPHVVLPVEPGRNVSQIIEVAALMQRLKAQGVHTAQAFEQRIQQVIQAKKAS